MPRGRQTDEEQLRRKEALFFERYNGPDCISQGYKEVDNVSASHRHDQHAVLHGLVRVTAASVLQAVLAGHARGHQDPVSIRTQGLAHVL